MAEQEVEDADDFDYLSDSDFKQLGFSIGLKLKVKHFMQERKAKKAKAGN